MSSSPWLLLISKHPAYAESGEVVLGQCEPYTSGWRLRLYRDGEEKILLEGTYYDLRKVQKDCAGKSLEAIQEVARKAKDRLGRTQQSTVVVGRPEDLDASGGDVTQTVTYVDSTQMLDADQIDAALAQMKKKGEQPADDDDETGEYVASPDASAPFEIVKRNGVVVATAVDPAILDNGEALREAFEVLMAESQGALVIDLGKVKTLSAIAANAVGEYTASSEEQGRFVALANVREEIVTGLQEMEKAGKITGTLVAYPEVDMAVEEALAFLNKS